MVDEHFIDAPSGHRGSPVVSAGTGRHHCDQQHRRDQTSDHYWRFTVTEKPLLLPSGS